MRHSTRSLRSVVPALLAACSEPNTGAPPRPLVPRDVAATDAPAVHVPGLAVEIAAGNNHTCARLRDGTVQCWGVGAAGQLGDDSGAFRGAPVRAHGLDGAVQVVAEGERSCAVRVDGSLWCWGRQLPARVEHGGLSAAGPPWRGEDAVLRPAQVHGWSGLHRIALARDHDCAMINGTAHCQGANTHSQLGDGTWEPRALPVAVRGLGRVDEIAVGYAYSCARSEGQVWCWGSNAKGQCGDDERELLTEPTLVRGLRGVQALALADAHACALLDDQTVHCWGDNLLGQLGDGTIERRRGPVAVVGLAGVRSLAAAGHHTAVVMADSTARGWGSDGPRRTLWPRCPAPRIAILSAHTDQAPAAALPLETCTAPATIPRLADVVQIALGSMHACALLRDGQVWCWGVDSYGVHGGPNAWSGPEPARIELSPG